MSLATPTVKRLPHAKQGRPLALGNLDAMVLDYVRNLRSCGCPVNRTIFWGGRKGDCPGPWQNISDRVCGHLELGRKWVEFPVKKQLYPPKSHKKARQLPNDFASVKEQKQRITRKIICSDGLWRSQRTCVQPLDWSSRERIKYAYKGSGR